MADKVTEPIHRLFTGYANPKRPFHPEDLPLKGENVKQIFQILLLVLA